MGIAEMVFGAIFWVPALLGLTAVAVSPPNFDLKSAFRVEVPGVGVPRQDVAEDVKALLEDWETATKDVEKVSFSARKLKYDSTFRIIEISHLLFESSDATHGRLLIRPFPGTFKNSTNTLDGIVYRYEAGRDYEEWSSDGVDLRHSDVRRNESQTLPLRNEQGEAHEFVSMVVDYGSLYRHLFAGFSTEKFLGRFNVVTGPMHRPNAEPKVYHLIFEPHEEGANGEFLRYIEKFEVMLDATSHQPTAIKFETPEKDRTVIVFNAKD